MIKSGILPPHTYAEWISILDMLKNKTNDEDVLQAMCNGTVEWQSGVAERFSKKLIAVVNYRINSATDKFQREMEWAQGREKDVVQALFALRKELFFVSKVMNLPALPEKERQQYYQLVIDQANSIQSSLEDSARSDRSGRLASIIRNNKVNAFEEMNRRE